MANRYAPDWVFGYFHRDTDGGYVLFEDHESEVNELKSELEALREKVSVLQEMHIDTVRHIWESRNCGSADELAEKHDALSARVAVLTDYIKRGAPINTNPDKCERKALLEAINEN